MSILNENISIFNNPADPIERMQPVCYQRDLVDPCFRDGACYEYEPISTVCMYNCAQNNTPKKVPVVVASRGPDNVILNYYNKYYIDRSANGHLLWFETGVSVGAHAIIPDTTANCSDTAGSQYISMLKVTRKQGYERFYEALDQNGFVFISKSGATSPPCSTNTFTLYYPYNCRCNAMCNIQFKCPYNIPISPCSCNGNTCSCNKQQHLCPSQCGCNQQTCPCNKQIGCTQQCSSHNQCPCNSNTCSCNAQCKCHTKG